MSEHTEPSELESLREEVVLLRRYEEELQKTADLLTETHPYMGVGMLCVHHRVKELVEENAKLTERLAAAQKICETIEGADQRQTLVDADGGGSQYIGW